MNSAQVSTIDTNALHAILNASPIVQIILLILVGMSFFCWAIAISKFQHFKELKLANHRFLNKFWKSSSLETLYEEMEAHPESSLGRVFKAVYLEMKKIADSPLTKMEGGNPMMSGLDNLERSLRKAMEAEVALMESRLTLLATTGSTGPFIGLFGTVWGIMGSFQKIGASGNASLAVVAPGISEALIATAIGLAAAIPAVMLYNHFIAQVRRGEMELNNFSSDFLNVVKRNFFQGH